MIKQKNFISRNDGFTCEACGVIVPPAQGTCRNHCTQCLVSKHVDDETPGDRSSSCQGPMQATQVEGTNPESLDLIHQCSKCGKIQRNKTASDDNFDHILAINSRRL